VKRALVPPLLALVAARATAAGVALAMGFPPLQAGTWVRWDSGLYLAIAQRGYFVGRCGPETGMPATAWCGDTAWFPAYSWLLALWARLGIDPAVAGALLSFACHAGMLLALWNLFLWERPRAEAAVALALAAFFPGGVYYQAVFPISLFLLAALVFLWAVANERVLLATVAGLLAAASYSTGLLLAPIALAWGMWRRRRSVLAWALPAAGVALGFAIVIAIMRLQTGRWNAFALAQSAYGYSFDPLDAFFARLKPLVNARYRSAATFATASQTLFVFVLAIASLAHALRARVRGTVESLVLLYSCAYYLLPLAVGGRVSLHRSESLLLPLVLFVPLRFGAVAVPISAAIHLAICAAFFAGSIV
jgi:Gpi18-like mannosyltransferase